MLYLPIELEFLIWGTARELLLQSLYPSCRELKEVGDELNLCQTRTLEIDRGVKVRRKKNE